MGDAVCTPLVRTRAGHVDHLECGINLAGPLRDLAAINPGVQIDAGFGTLVVAGLHPATGGNGQSACSGDMLLEALVACAGVTLNAVATALGIVLRDASLSAEGDLDFKGTLGVDKTAPVTTDDTVTNAWKNTSQLVTLHSTDAGGSFSNS